MTSPSNLYLDQDDLQRRLLDLTKKTGYDIVQKHGQRIYGGPPPSWTGSQPDKGTEVYCYRIPRDCFEDELVPVFSTVGTIYELRLMIEFSGTNRSYCYVRYTTQEEAREAIRKLNNYHVRPGYPLAVTRSVDNRKLSIKSVPCLDKETEDAVIEELLCFVEGVENVKFQARGWIEVEFSTHRLAALARRQLVPGNVVMFDKVCIKQVDWADPEIDTAGQEVVGKVLAVRNMPFNTPDYVVANMFNRLSEGQVFSVAKAGDTVLVRFVSHGGALLAMEKSRDSREMTGLEISWWSNRRVDRGSYSSIPRIQQMGGQNEGTFVKPGTANNAQSMDFMACMAQRNMIATQIARQVAQPPPDYNLEHSFSGLSLTQNPRQPYYAQHQPVQYPPLSLFPVPPNSTAFEIPNALVKPRSPPYSLFPSSVNPSSPKPVLAVPPIHRELRNNH